MGSGAGAAKETVDELCRSGERVGVAVIRLFRPFPTGALLAALPPSTRTVVVLDRTKEPGAPFEPLHLDVLAALWHSSPDTWADGQTPRVIGGRYGLSSKEFTPAMVKAVFDEAGRETPRNGFTIGIIDDVSHTSLSFDPSFTTDHARVRAVFYGLGADGTVGANKNTAKIVGKNTDLVVQAYFVYDSKKSGSMTISHLRFDPRADRQHLPDRPGDVRRRAPVELPRADGRARRRRARRDGVDQQPVSRRPDLGPSAGRGARGRASSAACSCTRSMLPPSPRLPASPAGSTPSCRRASSRSPACCRRTRRSPKLKEAIATTYGKRGDVVVQRNIAAVDTTLARLFAVPIGTDGHGDQASPPDRRRARSPSSCSASPPGCSPAKAICCRSARCRPTARSRPARRTSRSARSPPRSPIWEADLCIDCGKCAIVCPHAAIRMKVYEPGELSVAGADVLKTKSFRSREVPGHVVDRSGRTRRLHRMRAVRDGLPSARQERGQAQEHQPSPDRRAPRRRAGRLGCLLASARDPTRRSGIRRR